MGEIQFFLNFKMPNVILPDEVIQTLLNLHDMHEVIYP